MNKPHAVGLACLVASMAWGLIGLWAGTQVGLDQQSIAIISLDIWLTGTISTGSAIVCLVFGEKLI
jgi:hypothetical protein